MSGYWWCDRCRSPVDGRQVTFEKYHETCGHRVRGIEPVDEVDPRDAEIAALREQLAEVEALELNHQGACVRLKRERNEARAKALEEAARRIDSIVDEQQTFESGALSACGYALQAAAYEIRALIPKAEPPVDTSRLAIIDEVTRKSDEASPPVERAAFYCPDCVRVLRGDSPNPESLQEWYDSGRHVCGRTP